MCLAVPGRVISIKEDFATVDMLGFESEVFIGLLGRLQPNEYVLVHAGCAIEKIDREAFDYFGGFCEEMLSEAVYEE
jgi:hydrogenase assembly chaperone HypC/HupF